MTERIQELRKEIADISQESTDFLRRGRKDSFSLGEQERRVQRLQEIKDELMSLTAWKEL
jgi:ribosomal protein L29